MDHQQKKELLKTLLKRITQGEDVEKLKKEFGSLLRQVSPIEIPLLEQELVAEGVPVRDILRVCDLHVELFREALLGQELRDVPRGHPLDLLIRENDEILKASEALGLYASTVSRDPSTAGAAKRLLYRLYKTLRLHYVKNQMLLFPYLERMGLAAVPRVLWGREDQAIGRIRRLLDSDPGPGLPEELRALSSEIADLVFRENKILYPTLWALLEEEDWAAVKLEADRLGYAVEADGEWTPTRPPRYPYQHDGSVSPEKAERLPAEVRRMLRTAKPDSYRLVREGDVDLGTGFMRPGEVAALFGSLPVEVTFGDPEGRVRFFSESRLGGGFPRARTILGRRLLYCHPPRLEELVRSTVEKLRRGEKDYEVFWTRIGGRIVRVLIAAVRGPKGEYLGVAEMVEDFTEILENPEAIKEKVVVL